MGHFVLLHARTCCTLVPGVHVASKCWCRGMVSTPTAHIRQSFWSSVEQATAYHSMLVYTEHELSALPLTIIMSHSTAIVWCSPCTCCFKAWSSCLNEQSHVEWLDWWSTVATEAYVHQQTRSHLAGVKSRLDPPSNMRPCPYA